MTPDGKMLLAPLPAGITGSYGANLRRFCLMLHAQGQVTMERLTTLLNDVGVDVSKRQVVRLMTQGLDSFVAEDTAVLHAGLLSAPYITVDDTGARHARANFHTTQIGGAQLIEGRLPFDQALETGLVFVDGPKVMASVIWPALTMAYPAGRFSTFICAEVA